MNLDTPQGPVRAERHGDPGGPRLVITHGAGGSMDTPGIAEYANACAARGLEVIRFNQPSVAAGRRRPDSSVKMEATWRMIIEQLRDAPTLLVGGRSFGGRMASHVAAEGAPVDGLVFLGYPLHPVGKPEKIRDAHLSQITVPMLFIQGTKDQMATPALLDAVIARLPLATLHRLANGEHALTVRGRPRADVTDELADATIEWLPSTS